MVADCVGKLFSLILQKHGVDDGWMPENEGLEATGNLRAKSPTRIRTKGHGSMALWVLHGDGDGGSPTVNQ